MKRKPKIPSFRPTPDRYEVFGYRLKIERLPDLPHNRWIKVGFTYFTLEEAQARVKLLNKKYFPKIQIMRIVSTPVK